MAKKSAAGVVPVALRTAVAVRKDPRSARQTTNKLKSSGGASIPASHLKSSALVDTRVIYCGDNLEQLVKLPDACVDLIYIDPPFNSNRNYEVF